MRNPIDLAHLFADIMNSHKPHRFAELVSGGYVNHNPAVAPGQAGLVAFMGHWLRSIDIWRFENDRFVEHWDELNLLEVFQQMGAIPIAGGASR